MFYVVIQREVMKLSVQENFYDIYEIPMDVRLRLGPKGENR